MDTLSEIQHAVSKLSKSERSQLAMWIYEYRDAALRVAETAPAYDEPRRFMTVDEYLEFELQSPTRHEYVAGEVFAMNGVTLQHNHIGTRMLLSIGNHLRGGPCRPYISDVSVRLKLNMKEYFYYPDLMVVCDANRRGDEGPDSRFVRSPTLIMEILSPSTENIDRREKLMAYRQIETLEEYVLVAQDECEVTIYRRQQDWRPVILNSLEELAEFRSIRLSLPLAHIYQDAGRCGSDSP